MLSGSSIFIPLKLRLIGAKARIKFLAFSVFRKEISSMKNLIWILLVIWLGIVTITQFNTLNAAKYNTISIIGLIEDEKTLVGDMLEFNQRLDNVEKFKAKTKPKENKPCIVLPQGFNVVNPPSLWPDLSAKGII